MAYYHYQCQHCLCTTYLYDDGIDDGRVQTGAFDDCGCMNNSYENDSQEEDYDEDDD